MREYIDHSKVPSKAEEGKWLQWTHRVCERTGDKIGVSRSFVAVGLESQLARCDRQVGAATAMD